MFPSPATRPLPFPPQTPNSNPVYPLQQDALRQPPPLQAEPPDLSATLSTLRNLINFSEQTLNSVSRDYHLPLPKPQDDTHVPCPFNPNHRMPPEFLFRHSLGCPVALDLDISSLQYPKTLELSLESRKGHSVANCTETELCFPLDEFVDFGLNFFYKDCPGAVKFPARDGSSRMLRIPTVLLIHCGHSVNDSERRIEAFDGEGVTILPSELWEIRNEIGSWSDYPRWYSQRVLCALLGADMVKKNNIKRWVIVNSPFYGVIIDEYMRDHIYVLLMLCLKAVMTEATALWRNKDSNRDVNLGSLRIECPVFIQVLEWLASQFSVLYGEANAKFFAVNMFKYCIVEAASRISSFSDSREVPVVCDGESADNLNSKDEEVAECGKDGRSSVFYIAQIAAAVAALHERSVLEEHIRALRGPQQLPSYQRMAEHAFLSSKADKERRQCPNYRPIIDHDGLPRIRSSNQETNKTKTREELLAEERDYKRRRMSYRGKKLKRSTLQVMRDIIEEYMEEIKQAGGIGCFEKGAEDEGISQSAMRDAAFGLRGNSTKASIQDQYGEKTHHVYGELRDFKDPASRDYDERRRGSHDGQHDHLDDQRKSASRERSDRVYYSRGAERSKSHDQLHWQRDHRAERDDVDRARSKHQRQLSPRRSKNHNNESFSVSNSKGKDNKKWRVKDRHCRNPCGDHYSDYNVQNVFEDRYDPSESHDSRGRS